jgi:hypothetical protein
MAAFRRNDLEESFQRFERAAAKGHEDSIWVGSVVKDVENRRDVLAEAFTKTEEPLGYYFAGRLSGGRERFDFMKKSAAEAECSWGQVGYAWCFRYGDFVEKDMTVYMEWLEKAANQNNPEAIYWLGNGFRYDANDMEKALLYFRAAAELGWKESMQKLVVMLRNGERCEKDLREAAIWGAKGGRGVFWEQLEEAREAFESETTEDLGCDFNQLCYSFGWGLYWYQYGVDTWTYQFCQNKEFGNRCLDFYCSCVELQQKSIFTFLLCWNRTTGVKGPGQMIAQMVWEEREDNLVETFEEINGQEPETKRIKK